MRQNCNIPRLVQHLAILKQADVGSKISAERAGQEGSSTRPERLSKAMCGAPPSDSHEAVSTPRAPFPPSTSHFEMSCVVRAQTQRTHGIIHALEGCTWFNPAVGRTIMHHTGFNGSVVPST